MTINKYQGQTFKQVGIYFDQPIFTHGELYVAFSRVPNFSYLLVLIRLINNIKGYITNFGGKVHLHVQRRLQGSIRSYSTPIEIRYVYVFVLIFVDLLIKVT